LIRKGRSTAFGGALNWQMLPLPISRVVADFGLCLGATVVHVHNAAVWDEGRRYSPLKHETTSPCCEADLQREPDWLGQACPLNVARGRMVQKE
jgi:hypothetical protein